MIGLKVLQGTLQMSRRDAKLLDVISVALSVVFEGNHAIVTGR